MEKLKINDSYDSKLDTIIKRSGNELNKGKLLKVLLFRQFFMFLKTPKSYTVNIYGKRRMKENPNYLEYLSYKSVGELKKEIRREYKEEQEYY